MYGILFRVEAKPGKYQELINFLKWDVEVCRDEEPGTLRFDVYQDPQDNNALYVYEAYRDRAAFEAHKRNEPYRRWGSGQAEELTTNFEMLFNGDALLTTAG